MKTRQDLVNLRAQADKLSNGLTEMIATWDEAEALVASRSSAVRDGAAPQPQAEGGRSAEPSEGYGADTPEDAGTRPPAPPLTTEALDTQARIEQAYQAGWKEAKQDSEAEPLEAPDLSKGSWYCVNCNEPGDGTRPCVNCGGNTWTSFPKKARDDAGSTNECPDPFCEDGFIDLHDDKGGIICDHPSHEEPDDEIAEEVPGPEREGCYICGRHVGHPHRPICSRSNGNVTQEEIDQQNAARDDAERDVMDGLVSHSEPTDKPSITRSYPGPEVAVGTLRCLSCDKSWTNDPAPAAGIEPVCHKCGGTNTTWVDNRVAASSPDVGKDACLLCGVLHPHMHRWDGKQDWIEPYPSTPSAGDTDWEAIATLLAMGHLHGMPHDESNCPRCEGGRRFNEAVSSQGAD